MMRGAAKARHVAALERMAVEEARIVLDEQGPRLAPVLAALARQADRLRSEHGRGLHRGRIEAACAPCHGDVPRPGDVWPAGGPRQVPLDLYAAAGQAAAEVLLVFARRIARVEVVSDNRAAGAPIIGQAGDVVLGWAWQADAADVEALGGPLDERVDEAGGEDLGTGDRDDNHATGRAVETVEAGDLL